MIEKMASEIFCELVEIRHTLHQNPELGKEEFKTSAYIKDKLREYDIPFEEMAKTGVCAIIKGNGGARNVLLRADIDALPITEDSGVDYASKNNGLMHACGHDIHTACLLGAAKILSAMDLKSDVILAFEPDEEGDGGAELMIKEGIISKYNVTASFALHVDPLMKTGEIGIKDGAIMASPDDFEIIIKGIGGHGAEPEKCVNPVDVGIEIINNYKKEIKNIPNEQIVSICAFNGGNCSNVIPEIVTIKGTARTLDNKIRYNLKDRLFDIANNTAKEMGAEIDFKFNLLYPPTVNDDAMNDIVEESAKKLDCVKNIITLDNASMTGDDFSYFINENRGSYFKLGVGMDDNDYPLHSPKFKADDKALIVGSSLMAKIALTYMDSDK